MNKPLTIIIKETQSKLAKICNESGLHPSILDFIIQGLSLEMHSFAQRQATEEESAYAKMLEESSKNTKNTYDKTDSAK